MDSLPRLTPLTDRIQKIAKEFNLDGLVKVENDDASRNLSEHARLRRDLDYVFEFSLTEVKKEEMRWGVNEVNVLYRYVIYGKGRLVRLKDNLVVATKTSWNWTENLKPDTWTNGKTELLEKELDGALDRLAHWFVTDWIKPTLQQSQ